MFLNLFFSKIVDFSKKNWWIYLILAICLVIVYITWNWSLIEIIIMFLANFLWNLFIMIMQDYYSSWNNKYWAINQILWVAIFTSISIYWYIFKSQSQYLLWQIMYILAALNTVSFFVLKKDLKILNEYTFIPINIILLLIFINYIPHENFHILQAIWFSFITTWLVSVKDIVRYWLNIIWIWVLTLWSLLWVVISYNLWNLDWIALWYFLLTWTVFIFYIKLLPSYLLKNNI